MGDIYRHYFIESSHSIIIISASNIDWTVSRIVVIDANPAFVRMFGCCPDSHNLQECFIGDYSSIIGKLVKALEQNKKNIRVCLPEIERSYEISFSYLLDNQVSIDFLDVSEQTEDLNLMLAEQALKKSQVRYSLLLNKMQNIFVSFRVQETGGRMHEISYADANPSFEHLIGSSRSELFGKSPIGHFITDNKDEIQASIFSTFTTGQPSYFILHNSNLGIYLDAAVYRFDDTVVAMVASNITGLKKTEKKLRLAKEKAEESEQLKTAFLANMSHEIRTPLNGILGFSKLLARAGLSDEKKRHYISLIDNNGNHLISIISDILDIAKIESNQLEINKSDIELNALIDSLMEISNTILSTKDKRQLSISCTTGLPTQQAVIHTDPLRLTQILRNLIENAIKFTMSGSVNFGYKEYGDNHLYFFVKDTGIGIGQENLQVIFQHFRQENETITRKFGGSGLGLSICKHLVKELGGEIGVESEKGKGSTFYFILPFKKIKTQNVLSEISPEPEYGSKPVRIACCTSSEIFDSFDNAAQDKSLQFIRFQSIESAIEECQSEEYSAAIIDIYSVADNANEMLIKMKKAMPFIPIFATSFDLLETDRSFYTRLGYNDIFDLNTDARTLVSSIKYYLGI